MFRLAELVDARFLFPLHPLLFHAFCKLGEDLLFLEGGILNSSIGDDLLLKLLHLLFQEGLSCEYLPKSVFVPMLEMLFEQFQFGLEFMYA